MTTMTRFAVVASMVAALVACGGKPAPSVQQLQISPVVTEVTENLQAKVIATAIYSDGSTQDVTAEVAWSVQDAAVASAAAGLVRAAQPGSTFLTASWSGLQTAARVDVVAATLLELTVSTDAASLPAGVSARAVATGLFSDGSIRDVTAAATWSASHTAVQVKAGGAVKGLAPGLAQVLATVGGLTAAAEVEVIEAQVTALELRGVAAEMPLGLAGAYRVMATFTDASVRDVTADAVVGFGAAGFVASDLPGVLKALLTGATEVVASYAGFTASAPVQVTAAAIERLEVSCSKQHVKKGDLVGFTATATYTDGQVRDVTSQVAWLSSNPMLAVVSTFLMPGAVLAFDAGTVSITALDPASQVSGTFDLVVNK